MENEFSYTIKIFGYFTQACFYNFAAELMTYIHCHWANAAVTAGSYVMIEDSNNHQDITSAFVAQTSAGGTAGSFNEAKFISCIFNKSAGGKTIRLMGDSMARHYFDNCYAISVDDVAIGLLSPRAFRIYSWISTLRRPAARSI